MRPGVASGATPGAASGGAMRTARRLVLWLLLAVSAASPARAVNDPAEMLPDPAAEARAQAIGRQLRCLVCQNESIEESHAELAGDLRRVVRARVASGESDAQVMDWVVARYGDFVRLRPPVNAATLLLWGSPVLAVLLGLGAAVLARRRTPVPPAPLTEAERARLADLTRPGPTHP